MTGATPVDRKAGKVKKVPPPATALTAEPIRPARTSRPKSAGARPNIAYFAATRRLELATLRCEPP